MDVYRQAAFIAEQVSQGRGTAKAMCLQKQMQKKKQTYAVVCETLRNLDRIKKVLETAEFFKYYPALASGEGSTQKCNTKFLVYCMTYDQLYGKGVNTRQHPAAHALTESKDFLFEADSKLPKLVPRSYAEKQADEAAFAEEEARAGGGEASGASTTASAAVDGGRNSVAYSFPRYARINRLMFPAEVSNEDILARLQKQTFRRSGVAMRRERNDILDSSTTDLPPDFHPSQLIDEQNKPRMDEHLPGLIVFPPGTDLHAHPLVKQGKLLLQDKASCLPAAVMCDLVPCSDEPKIRGNGKIPQAGFGFLVDGCAAPGNKTTQLAEYSHEQNFYNNISDVVEVEEVEEGSPENKEDDGNDNNDDDANQQDGSSSAAAAVAKKEYSTQVIAVERDPSRFKLLQDRMTQLAEKANVKCKKGSFEEIFDKKQDIEKVGAILLDPSCSSSGVLSRIDQQLRRNQHYQNRAQERSNNNRLQNNNSSNNTENEGGEEGEEKSTNYQPTQEENEAEDQKKMMQMQAQAEEKERQKVKELSEEQLSLVVHALTQFPNCKRVVYSTCSIHQAENENVVLAALDRALKHKNNKSSRYNKRPQWRVTRIMPDSWATRGRYNAEEAAENSAELPFSENERKQIASSCIRCDPFDDKTSGFFVARFDRD